ncbi:MAG: AAA-like domain-containing protein [Myxococcota bacterium]
MSGYQRWLLPDGQVDLSRGVVVRGGVHTQLTQKETQVLRYLADQAGLDVHRDDLLRDVWGFPGRLPATRAADLVVLRLRRKIERDPAEPTVLVTVHGHGYRLQAQRHAVDLQRPQLAPPGTPYDPSWYAPRPDEERAAANLLEVAGAPAVLLGPQGEGKSWLLHHLVAGFAASDVVVVLDAAVLPPGEALEHIALEIVDAAGRTSSTVADAWSQPGTSRRHLARLLSREVLPNVEGRLVLALDRADLIAKHQDAEGVYAVLRSLASRPGPPWDRLRLILAIRTEPGLLVSEPGASPFNLAPPIRLGPLPEASVASLAARYGDWSSSELAELRDWLGGQAFLVRRALHVVATGTTKQAALSDPQIYADVLRSRLAVLRPRPDLTEIVRALCREGPLTVEPFVGHELERVGIVELVGGQARFPCRLMRQFLCRAL